MVRINHCIGINYDDLMPVSPARIHSWGSVITCSSPRTFLPLQLLWSCLFTNATLL